MRNFILFVIVLMLMVVNTLGLSRSLIEDNVEEIFKWKKILYENPPQSENSYVGPYKYYIPENNNMESITYHPASGLMIVNVLRIRPGVPVTLGAFCVNEYTKGSSPKIWGFPDYEANTLQESDFYETRSLDYGRKRSRRGHKKPNKYHHGNYYNNYYINNYHGHNPWTYHYSSNHKPYNKPSYYAKPSATTTTTTEKPEIDFRIISTYTTYVDEKCNRAFTIDIGVLNYYNNDSHVIQKPAILAFSLPKDGCQTRNFPLIRRSEIPDSVVGSNAFGIIFFTLDFQSNDCDDFFIYIAGAFSNNIIVYDYKNDDYWSFTNHPTFAPVIAESHLVFDKTFEYDLPLGIGSIALGYADEYGDRPAYYFPGASNAQFAVSTEVLKDKKKSPTYYHTDDFAIMGYRGCNHQTAKSVIDYTYGVMFYSEMQSNSVRCWNLKKPLNPDNIGVIYHSEDKLPFASEIFIDSRGYLWFNSCSLPFIFLSDQPLNLQKYNNRIFRVKVSDAIRGTVCEDEDSY